MVFAEPVDSIERLKCNHIQNASGGLQTAQLEMGLQRVFFFAIPRALALKGVAFKRTSDMGTWGLINLPFAPKGPWATCPI